MKFFAVFILSEKTCRRHSFSLASYIGRHLNNYIAPVFDRGPLMYQETSKKMAMRAVEKMNFLKNNLFGFMLSSMMAGAYVGVGIILILTLGNDFAPEYRNLVMGCFFGIALTLIVFSGAELFSGHTMVMTFGFLHKRIKFFEVIYDWFMCWQGNLLGAILLSILFVLGGGGGWVHDSTSLVHQISDHKINSTIVELVARGALCNWLIYLAIWMVTRTENDMAKCMLIFWCLFAFIAAGFEHGVANMSVFTISMLGAHSPDVTLLGICYNLFWVSIGNIIGGAGFIGVAYYLTGSSDQYIE